MRAAQTCLRIGAAALLLTPLLAAACGDSSSDGEGGGGSGANGSGADGSGIEGGICIDRAGPLRIVEPSGLQLKFRVLDVNGDPVRPLVAGSDDVTIINDEKGLPFGDGGEGQAASDVGDVSNIEIYSVVALDLSDSITQAGVLGDVLDAAREFITATVVEPEAKFKHRVALMAIGRPDETVFLVDDFTQDADELFSILDGLESEPGRGTTALYNAYIGALQELERQGDDTQTVVERFLVMLTDGTHEAGGEEALRKAALDLKHVSRSTIYAVGIQGEYDACKLEELAGRGATPCSSPTRGCREGNLCTDSPAPPSCTQFFADIEPSEIGLAFRDVAERVSGIARSNYAIGICTPVAQGTSSVTLQVEVDGKGDQKTLPYCAKGVRECDDPSGFCPCTALLTGELSQCDVEQVRTAELEPITTCPSMPEDQYLCSYLQIPEQIELGCTLKPEDVSDLCNRPGSACAHNECGTGVALDPSCSPCATAVCLEEPFCCDPDGSWNEFVCVDLARQTEACGCTAGEGGGGAGGGGAGGGGTGGGGAGGASTTGTGGGGTTTAATTGAGGGGGGTTTAATTGAGGGGI